MENPLLERLLKFRDARDWKQFHTPRNLATALIGEVGELLEIFRWKLSDEITPEEIEKIKGEVADINIFLTYFCASLDIDLDEATLAKVERNESRYTIEKSKGVADKIKENE